jgi:hypothetical protein
MNNLPVVPRGFISASKLILVVALLAAGAGA